MVLPGGVTGFWDGNDAGLTVTDLRTFREHCHEAVRRAGGRVVSITSPNSDRDHNFAVAVLAAPSGDVAVLLNAHHPIVAFAKPPAEGEVLLRFQDHPALAEAFDSFGVYQIASAGELEEQPTADHLRELSPIEHEQIEYWNPQRVGDIVFNFWD